MEKRENADGAYWRPRRFVADVSFERLAAEAVDVARVGFIDGIATMIAGADDPAPQLLRKALRPGHGDPGHYFSGETVPAPKSAWINGTAGGEARRTCRIYRRLCSVPGCPGFDASGRHLNKPELRSGGLRSLGIGPGTGRPRSRRPRRKRESGEG